MRTIGGTIRRLIRNDWAIPAARKASFSGRVRCHAFRTLSELNFGHADSRAAGVWPLARKGAELGAEQYLMPAVILRGV